MYNSEKRETNTKAWARDSSEQASFTGLNLISRSIPRLRAIVHNDSIQSSQPGRAEGAAAEGTTPVFMQVLFTAKTAAPHSA